MLEEFIEGFQTRARKGRWAEIILACNYLLTAKVKPPGPKGMVKCSS